MNIFLNKFLEEIKDSFEITELPNEYRINGVIDLKKYGLMINDLISQDFYKFDYSDSGYERFKNQATQLLSGYPKRPPFKKLKTGNMSYKEFKNKTYNIDKK